MEQKSKKYTKILCFNKQLRYLICISLYVLISAYINTASLNAQIIAGDKLDVSQSPTPSPTVSPVPSPTPAPPQKLPIIYYHAHENLGYTDAAFTEHMDFLAANDYHTITLDQFYEWRTYQKPLPIRPLAITFDDSYIKVYTNVFPIIQERNLSITNFVITRSVGLESSLHYCDWAELKAMQSSGYVDNQSHTVSHPRLASLSTADLYAEVINSKISLQTNIPGKPCNWIAYPYGSYNNDVIDQCTYRGYKGALTTVTGFNNRLTPLYELRRQPCDHDDLEGFKNHIGYYELPPAPPGKGWTIDNRDVNCYYDYSNWTPTTNSSGYYGQDFLFTPEGDGSIKCRWAAYLPKTGLYNVYSRWVAFNENSASADYEIKHLNGTIHVIRNQQDYGSTWNKLGTFYFDKNIPAEVILSSSADGMVIADGVWFEPIDPGANLWSLY